MSVPDLRLPSRLEPLDDERLRQTRVFLKRDDLIHPDFPGNKWRKLKYNLAEAGEGVLLTFGGAYSNHLLATAAAGHYFGFETIGIVRGDEHTPFNPVLSRAAEFGMRLVHVDRTHYRARNDRGFHEWLRQRFGDFYLIPEGGANSHALRGTAEIPGEIDEPFDVMCCACGTGATLAGAATALKPGQRAIGYPALKGGDFLAVDIHRLQREYGKPTTNWSLDTGYHFGGFARSTPELDAFVADFRDRHGIALDPIYEGKMMYGVFRTRWKPGTTIVTLLA